MTAPTTQLQRQTDSGRYAQMLLPLLLLAAVGALVATAFERTTSAILKWLVVPGLLTFVVWTGAGFIRDTEAQRPKEDPKPNLVEGAAQDLMREVFDGIFDQAR